jgi:hypothetical protein
VGHTLCPPQGGGLGFRGCIATAPWGGGGCIATRKEGLSNLQLHQWPGTSECCCGRVLGCVFLRYMSAGHKRGLLVRLQRLRLFVCHCEERMMQI